MTYNHKESLEHLKKVGMLNEKGLLGLLGIVQQENIHLKMKIMDLESKLQYKK